MVVSAFEPSHTGSFSVDVESSHSFDFKVIPQEGAGMYKKTVRGEWCVWLISSQRSKLDMLHRDERTAMGGPTFKQYSSNPVFEIDVRSPAEVK